MPSGKQSKRRRQQARSAPPPVRRKGAAGRRASPVVLITAGVVVVAIALGVGLFAAFHHSSSSSTTLPTVGTLKNGLPQAGLVERQLHGIPQQGNVLGSSSAPVTMVEYVDPQCPYCQRFETQAFPQLLTHYVRRGKLKVEARIVSFIGPDSKRGQLAAIAAGRQGKLFNFLQLLYLNQGPENTGWLSQSLVDAAVASIPGLRVREVLDGAQSSSVQRTANTFDAARITATPTILVGRSGAQPKQVTLTTLDNDRDIAAAVDRALRR